MPGVHASLIVDAARKAGAQHVTLVADMDSVPSRIAQYLAPGDLVLVLGAGNINRIVAPLLDEVRKR